MPTAAEAWTSADAYESFIGRWSRKLAPVFLDRMGIPAGESALDVGCGTGALSEALLARGFSTVVGVDASPAYVSRATHHLGRRGAFFLVGDAQDLRLRADRFDAVVSGLTLNFLKDPLAAAREMTRVARPGGVVATYLWDYADRMRLLRAFWDAATENDPARAGPLDEARRFPLARPEPLAALLRDAGLADVRDAVPIEVVAEFRDFDEAWGPFLGKDGPAPGHVASLAEAARNALRERFRGKLSAAPDGTIRLALGAWAVRGVKP